MSAFGKGSSAVNGRSAINTGLRFKPSRRTPAHSTVSRISISRATTECYMKKTTDAGVLRRIQEQDLDGRRYLHRQGEVAMIYSKSKTSIHPRHECSLAPWALLGAMDAPARGLGPATLEGSQEAQGFGSGIGLVRSTSMALGSFFILLWVSSPKLPILN